MTSVAGWVPIKACARQPDASQSFSIKCEQHRYQARRDREARYIQRPDRIIRDGTCHGDDNAKDDAGGCGGGHEERTVDGAGGPSTGLNRTGKSCRLRWVNYLHPGLKRGRMTPQEEGLVLELHDKWGNRWSRIARKLPGRTDNEIKNYWRTLMRKKAQGRNESVVSSSPSSSSSASSNVSSSVDGSPPELTAAGNSLNLSEVKGYTMDQIWNEIAASESVSNLSFEEYEDGSARSMCGPMASPLWEDCESLWRRTDTEAMRMMSSMSDFFDSNCKQSIDDSSEHRT